MKVHLCDERGLPFNMCTITVVNEDSEMAQV